MLLVGEEALPTSIDGKGLLDHLENSPGLIGAIDEFLGGLASRADDRRKERPDRKCVVVMQGEIATVQARNEPPLLIGSEDATTCVIVVAECRETGWYCSAHVDDGTVMRDTVQLLLRGMAKPAVYLVGAYRDKEGTGAQVASALLSELHSDPRAVSVNLACLGSRNTSLGGKPIARDLLFDTQTLRPVAARVAARCRGEAEALPGFTLRHARLWMEMSRRGVPAQVYDTRRRMMVIPAFEYELDANRELFFRAMLRLADDDMLQYTSTSPEDEREEFAAVQKSTFAWVLENPRHSHAFRGELGQGIAYRWLEEEASRARPGDNGLSAPRSCLEAGVAVWERLPLEAGCDRPPSLNPPAETASSSGSRAVHTLAA